MNGSRLFAATAIFLGLWLVAPCSEALGQGNPLEPPSGGGDDGNPLKPPPEEKPKEVLKRAGKETCEAVSAKYRNEEKDPEARRKLRLEAITEAAEIDEKSMVKLLATAAADDNNDEAVRKAAEEALAKKIKHLEGLYKNEAEEDRIAAVDLALNFEDPRALRLFRRARKDASKKVKEIAQKGALAYLENLMRSKDPSAKMDAIIEASEMMDVKGMEKILALGLKENDEKVKELAVRFSASLKRTGILKIIYDELERLEKLANTIELQVSYLRAAGDSGELAVIDLVLKKRLKNLTKFDGADPDQVKINLAVFDALSRLAFRASVALVMQKWALIDDATRSRDSAPQTEEGRKVAQKYYNACAAAMTELCGNLPKIKAPENLSDYGEWKKWYNKNKNDLPFK